MREQALQEVECQETIFPVEDWRPETNDERFGHELVSILEDNGYLAYFAGGYARDLVMHKLNGVKFSPHDVDVATSATTEEMKRLFNSQGVKYIEVGAEYGVLKARREQERGASEVEIATFRVEGEYEDGRRPKAEKIEFVTDPEADVLRRDLTINALLFDPIKKQVIDYVGGIDDIKSKTLRFVGQAEERINEDALRMLRYVRFLTRFDFKFSREAQEAIKKNADKIDLVSRERVREELEKTLAQPNFWSTINNLYRVGLLERILPELAQLFKLEQSKERHEEGDAYRHTLEMLRSFGSDEFLSQASKVLGGKTKDYESLAKARPNLVWAGLFHDLGKTQTRRVTTDRQGGEKITFYGHEKVSQEVASGVMQRLRFRKRDSENIAWLAGQHMTMLNFSRMRAANQKKLMLDDRFADLVLLYLGDCLSSWPKNLEEYEKIKKIYLGFRNSAEYKKLKVDGSDKIHLSITGDDVMALGIEEGERVGEILEAVEEATLAGKARNRKQALKLASQLANSHIK